MHVGFVSIIGRPNVGKSTLLNHLVGLKLAGVSPKPQTTRQVIRGILTTEKGQIIFLDTPGHHKPKDELGVRMMRSSKTAFEECDLIFWMVSPGMPGKDETIILNDLKLTGKPILLLVNKVDAVQKLHLLPILAAYQKMHSFAALIPISAMKGDNLNVLLDKAFELLPEGELFFPEDQTSDQTERFIVSEMIREKVFRLTGEEIPYAAAVEIEDFKERTPALIYVSASIYVEKFAQKKIVVGKDGQMVKRIGEAARKDIEEFLDKKVFLELWVKVQENWKRDGNFIKRIESQ